MKFLIEIKDKYSSITLLTDNHSEIMRLYNLYKDKEISIKYLKENDEEVYLNGINIEAYLASPLSE